MRYFMWSDKEKTFVEVSSLTYRAELETCTTFARTNLVNNKFVARQVDEGGDYASWFYDVSFGNVHGTILAEFINVVANIQGKFVTPRNCIPSSIH